MTFETLGLSTEILRAVADQGYSEPTPIQQQAIPLILQGRDLLASAQTGTGKTASFTLPLLHRLGSHRRPQRRSSSPRALILTPTRELAAQVGESVQTYGQYLPMRSAIVYGGVKIGPQIQKLRRGVDILIATPGRLLDHLGQGTLTLEQVEMLVLDEGDRMLDMGFLPDIRKILAQLPQQRQTMLFSATFSPAIKRLAADLLTDPVQVEVAPHNTAAETVEQLVHPVDRHRKRELLSHMIGYRNWGQVLVFTRTKHGANRLAEQLAKDGLKTEAIHGNKSQAARSRALAKFKQGSVQVLVATDIAARGLDIDHLPHVVNFELPMVPEDYVHRIGRTGRAGKEGQAISLVSPEEYALLRGIERLLKRDLPKDVVPGYEPTAPLHSEIEPPSRRRTPSQRYRSSGGGRDQARSQNRPARTTPAPVKHTKIPVPRSGKQIHSA